MTTNSKLVRYKQQRIQIAAKNNDSYSFFNLLTGPEMLSKVEELLPDTHRERQFTPDGNLIDVSCSGDERGSFMSKSGE